MIDEDISYVGRQMGLGVLAVILAEIAAGSRDGISKEGAAFGASLIQDELAEQNRHATAHRAIYVKPKEPSSR